MQSASRFELLGRRIRGLHRRFPHNQFTCEPKLDSIPRWHHDALMRTTVNINDALLKELRTAAAAAGLSFREMLEETLAAGLAAKRRSTKRFRVKPHDLDLKPGFRNQSLNQIYDQLEAEDATR